MLLAQAGGPCSGTAAAAGARVRRTHRPSAAAAHPHITFIATDVDGTLLNSRQELSPTNEAAVQQAAAAGVPLIVATGKARGPWARDVLPRLGPPMPGVFLQGLLVCDAQGRVLFSRSLAPSLVAECVALARGLGLTLTAYCGDRILCDACDSQTDRLLFYKEPTPEGVGDLLAALAGEGEEGQGRGVQAQKLIFMGGEEAVAAARPLVQAQLEGRASLTTAIPGMLEVLPLGASKGAGVALLLRHLGVDPAGLMALGDGENDVEMLQLAGWGVAVGNAGPGVKAVADAVVASNDEEGVAQAIREFVLQPRAAAATSTTGLQAAASTCTAGAATRGRA